MSKKARRRLVFVGLFFLLPWPLTLTAGAFVPAIRYLILGMVAATVAVAEGAAGPVGPVVAVLLVWALVCSAGCWALAWLAASLLERMPPRLADALCVVALLVGLGIALLSDPYRTPYGRAATGGLLEILS